MPFHPMLVHFPIALLLASVLFDLLGVLRRDERFHHAGYFCLVLGVAGAFLAVASGLADASQLQERFARLRAATAGGGGFPGGAEARFQQMLQMVSVHRLLALAVLAVFLVALVWRVSQKGVLTGRALGGYLLVAVLGAAILVSTAFYGGELAHGRRGGPDGARPGFGQERAVGGGLPSRVGAPASGPPGAAQ